MKFDNETLKADIKLLEARGGRIGCGGKYCNGETGYRIRYLFYARLRG